MVATVVEDAVSYLLDQQGPDSLWADFDTLAGESDEWVTAYVAASLASVDDPAATDASRAAWRRLVRHRFWRAGWGYTRGVPCDADSTAWALRLADRVEPAARLSRWRASRYLRKHQRDDGGIATYRLSRPIRRFTGLSRDVSFDGWCHSHPSVTAATLHYLDEPQRDAAIQYLRETQADAGCWPSYWWTDPAYTTALAATALERHGDRDDETRIAAAVEWATDQIDEDGRVVPAVVQSGSPFATACCLRTLRLRGVSRHQPAGITDGGAASQQGRDCGADVRISTERDEAAADRAIEWLHRTQRFDGSWDTAASLQIPPPDVVDPETYDDWTIDGRGGGSVVFDQHRTFTTATVLSALCPAIRGSTREP